MRRSAGVVVVVLALAASLTSCDWFSSVVRPDEPVVLTGAQVPALVGTAPNRIVAFIHTRPKDVATWTQIPVQVDQRKNVDFGVAPASNTTPGVTGTVYGGGTSGVSRLQYADPNTFVGADADPNFDADDELVFLVGDGGGNTAPDETGAPAHVVPGSGVRVQFDDPLAPGQQGWVFLFVSDGTLDPAAGRDDVQYQFNLTSGAYKTTYRRADGPNPETSVVTTPSYQIRLHDRWIEDDWSVTAGGASGVDILDGEKARFALSTCGRSNATFADAEGAFVANIDGPVRAIRSYVGANSGPLTQRTQTFYRDRVVLSTDLRVHPIPGVMDFVDFNTNAIGMTFSSSAYPGGVPIDGVADPGIGTALNTWALATGPQGSVMMADGLESSIVTGGTTLDSVADGFYRDELNSPVDQCWGDPHFIGATGTQYVTAIPNTDPRTSPTDTFRSLRTFKFSGPGATNADAATWGSQVASPVTLSFSAYPG